jgi:ferredoxin-thioredoxin reductase catalytic chain
MNLNTNLSLNRENENGTLPFQFNLKILESIQQFAENYAKSTDTYFCMDLEVTNSVIQGLVVNKEQFGAPLCPCRYYDNKEDEISLAYWNCPCVPMRERKECHCMLFLKKNNEFSSNNQSFFKL